MSEPRCKVCGGLRHNHGDRHVAGWHDFEPDAPACSCHEYEPTCALHGEPRYRQPATHEPSKEAEEIFRTAYDTFGQSGVIAALQKLIDERDYTEQRAIRAEVNHDTALARAEAAEKERDAERRKPLARMLFEMEKRAEVAEKHAADHGHWCAAHIRRAEAARADLALERCNHANTSRYAQEQHQRAEALELERNALVNYDWAKRYQAAEARLAECVREVLRFTEYGEDMSQLRMLMQKYEAKP